MSLRNTAAVLLMIPAMAAAQPVLPLSSEQAGRLRCAAAMAIASSEQQRGAPGWEGFPAMAERGGPFIAFVGEALMKETGRSRDDIREEIGTAIDALQDESTANPDPKAQIQATVRDCIVLMDQLMPAGS